MAHTLNNSSECLLFYPNFRSIFLTTPLIDSKLPSASIYDLRWGIPMRNRCYFTGSVFDGIPIDVTSQPGIIDDASEAFIIALCIIDQIASDELIIKLPQRELETLSLVIIDYQICRDD